MTRHCAEIVHDTAPVSAFTAVCACDWIGPRRERVEQAERDVRDHTRLAALSAIAAAEMRTWKGWRETPCRAASAFR